MDDYKVIEEFNENQLEELHSLFKNEWWTQKRQLSDIMKLLDNSSVVTGLVNDKTGELIRFARVISDTLYRAFIFDVIAKENYRNNCFISPCIKIYLHLKTFVTHNHFSFIRV